MRRRLTPFVLLALAAAFAALPSPAAAAPPPSDQYIVVLKDGADSSRVASQHRVRHGARIKHVYSHALKGYAARVSGQELGALRSDPRVDHVVRDGEARASVTQTDPTWGLDRVDARSGLDSIYSYTQTGAGVKAYIIDTGIRSTHTELSGRVSGGYTSINDGKGTEDCDGHGTHVAGTVGGTAYGVAKAVTLVPVRVLDCSGSGTWSGVIAGVDYVTGDHVPGAPAVANMSLGGGANSAVDDAVRNSIADGVSYAIAAGNGNTGGKEQDACGYSPARVAEAITIGATAKDDSKTSWSNYGACVDWFAPGAGITSAWSTSDTATNTISGTSMATPHVAGAAALYLEATPTATAQQVRDALYAATTKGIVTSSKTENNHLLYTLFGTTSDATDTTAPETTISSVTIDGTSATFGFTANETATFECSLDGAAFASCVSPKQYTGLGDGAHVFEVRAIDSAGNIDATPSRHEWTVGSTAAPSAFTLSASPLKIKGVQHADLAWSGTVAGTFDIYRNDRLVGNDVPVTAGSDGLFRHRDNIGAKGGGSYTYYVCEANTTTCSSTATIVF